MGDPTLRMHVVAPPANLVATANRSGGADLQWSPSSEPVLGYHVYRAPTAAGPFNRLNANLIGGTIYTDASPGTNTYMVRAVKLEVSASGSYYNASRGIFCDFVPPSLPVLTITVLSTNKLVGQALPEFAALYSGFVNGDTPSDLDVPPVLSTPATPASSPGDYPIHASGAADANYLMHFVDGTLTILPASVTGAVTSSANPAQPGESVVFTMGLSAVSPGEGIPTGSVQFKIDGTNAGPAVPLNAGAARLTNLALAHGLHTVVAEYAGDGNFLGTTNRLLPDQLINTPPVAGSDTVERDSTSGVKVSRAELLTNNSDADGDALSFVGASGTSTNGRSVVTEGDWLFYTPLPGFTNTDAFTYIITDSYSGPVTGLVTIAVRLDLGPSPNLTLTDLGDGRYLIRGDGIPGRTYRIQASERLEPANWQTLGTAVADSAGGFSYLVSPDPQQSYYRSVYP